MVDVIDRLLAAVPQVRFADSNAVAFMLAATLGGSVRVVMEAGASEEDLAQLRNELPRACFAYLEAVSHHV
jgi:hypothetical protein